jgi:segregation and condensation protein B
MQGDEMDDEGSGLNEDEEVVVEAPGEHAGDGEPAAGEGPVDLQSDSRLESIVESMLFAAGAPVGIQRLTEVLNGPSAREVRRAVESLTAHYDTHERGIRLVAVAGGYQFRTAPENNEWVRALLRERPSRLGRATLETLAVIAYKQPVTRADIEAVRGVDADSALSTLLAKRLIKIAGRKETVGRPLLYATTQEFLEVFGLKDLHDLPALKEIGPVPETDDEAGADDIDEGRTTAEAVEPGGDQLAATGGGADPRGAGAGEQPSGDGVGDEGGPDAGPDHG